MVYNKNIISAYEKDAKSAIRKKITLFNYDFTCCFTLNESSFKKTIFSTVYFFTIPLQCCIKSVAQFNIKLLWEQFLPTLLEEFQNQIFCTSF